MARILVIGVFCFCFLFVSEGFAQTAPPTRAGKVSICKEIDDDWKCVGESDKWAANVPFNVLFVNPKSPNIDFIGLVFYKQDANGKDTLFITEYQQNIGEENRKYATTGNELKLPPGTYSVYIISWAKRELLNHNGNLTDYLAKTTLTVK